MKKIILLSAMCAVCTYVQSQSWNITGNTGTNASTNFIGTTDNIPFKIRTKNVVRVTVNGSGKVGVGTSSPVFKLDVKGGSINTDSVYRIGGNAVLSIKGLANTFMGTNSGFSNTTGSDNTACGYYALYYNTGGNYNTATGMHALNYNVLGNSNTAYGMHALYENTYGSFNTANGNDALLSNTQGIYNTANGYSALYANLTGLGNSAFGCSASFTDDALNNTSCIGYASGGIVNASNRIELGNTSVSVIAGQVGFSTYSDARIKDNVKEDVPGLAFISKLRPVTYNLNIHRENEMVYKGTKKDDADWAEKYDIEKIKMTGFLAQDVEKAAKETGYDFSGVQKPANPDELYSLRYSDFVMPLVKSVQELSMENTQLKNEIAQIKAVMTAEQQQKLKEFKSDSHSHLEQNTPNPFNSQTEIKFQLPVQFSTAFLIINDESGKQIKIYNVQSSNTILIKSDELSAGIYSYLLIVDGITIDSKQMVFTK